MTIQLLTEGKPSSTTSRRGPRGVDLGHHAGYDADPRWLGAAIRARQDRSIRIVLRDSTEQRCLYKMMRVPTT